MTAPRNTGTGGAVDLTPERRLGDVDVVVALPRPLFERLRWVCKVSGDAANDVIADALASHLDELDFGDGDQALADWKAATAVDPDPELAALLERCADPGPNAGGAI